MSSIQNPKSFCGHDLARFVEVDDHENNTNFTCGACRTPIAGKRFSCRTCGFHLHPFCKTCPSSLSSSTFHPQHTLTLMSAPPTPLQCDVCSDRIQGNRYSCHVDRRCDFDVHPVCSQVSMLPRVHHVLDPHSLELQHRQRHTRTCNVCRLECGGWAYRCVICSVDIHIWCLLTTAVAAAPPGAAPGATGQAIPTRSRSMIHEHGHGQAHQPFYFGLPNNAYMHLGYPMPGWAPGWPALPPVNYPNATGPVSTGNSNGMLTFMGTFGINLLVNLFSNMIQNDIFGNF